MSIVDGANWSSQQEERVQKIENVVSQVKEATAVNTKSIEYINDNIKTGFTSLEKKFDDFIAAKKESTAEFLTLKDDVKDLKKEREKSMARWTQIRNYVLPPLFGGLLFALQKVGALIISSIATP